MRGFKLGACSAAVVVALTVAGCGSSDDDSSSDETTTTTEITKTEFVTQANQICASSNQAMDAAAKKIFGDKPPSQEDLESFMTATVIPQVESQLTAIHALGVPEGEEDQVNEILDAADSALEEAKSDPAAMADENADPFAEANKLAAAYGLNECAS